MSQTIFLRLGDAKTLTYRAQEAARYLGYRDKANDTDMALFDAAADEARQVAAPKACYMILPVTVCGTRIDAGALSIDSRDLAKNLAGCSEVVLFAATLGAGVDRCILKYSKTQPSRAMVLDAVCSSMVECWCDVVNGELTAGRIGKPRYSPGYGDVPLSVQKELLALLDAQRKLGITLSDTCFMTPTKSVTAFIGLKGDTTP